MVHIPGPARLPLLDAALTAGLLAAAVVLGFNGGYAEKASRQFADVHEFHRVMRGWWLFAGLIVIGMLMRHRWPLAAFALVAVGAGGHEIDPRISAPLIDYAVPIVLYTVASLARSRWVPVGALLVATVGHYLLGLYVSLYPPDFDLPVEKLPAAQPALSSNLLLDVANKSAQFLLLLVLAVALGEGVRARRAHLATVERRAADLEREQQQRAALAIAAERARITRELHDVVAHGLSVMVVQAQGAAAALRRHPDRTAAALQDVIAVGRGSLAEMRRLLGVVRRDPVLDGGADPMLAPQPGMEALPALVDQVRAAGTTVRLDLHGEPVALSPGVDLSAYRIVQEALTNALKHAGPGARVTVDVTFAPDRLAIEVTDDGAGPVPDSTAPDGSGSGLRGIAERVAMLGGTLSAGPGPDRGFRVRVVLPLAAGPLDGPAADPVDRLVGAEAPA
jgi:signal transduction histidine kinase